MGYLKLGWYTISDYKESNKVNKTKYRIILHCFKFYSRKLAIAPLYKKMSKIMFISGFVFFHNYFLIANLPWLTTVLFYSKM